MNNFTSNAILNRLQRVLLVVVLLLAGGCTDRSTITKLAADNSAQGVTEEKGLDVVPATSDQCAAGGQVYSVYVDDNKNGARDQDEQVVNSQIICNGRDGSNGTAGADGTNGSNGAAGLSSLVSLNRVVTGLSACASGAGLQVNSGLDADSDQVLDPSEISSAQIVCDGDKGETGSQGAAGSNGHGVVLKTVAAAVESCSSGGTTLLLALDIHDDGVYASDLPGQQILTLCNGHDGVTPAYAPVEPILACGATVNYKEVLLRLQNGQVLGSFSNDTGGTMTRLAFLPDGTFMNTDDSGCTFSLSTSGDGGTRSISWSGQVQQSWPLSH